MTSDTRIRASLDLLDEIEKGTAASQLSLSKRMGIAVGLVNSLLRRAIRKGYVKVQQAPPRRYIYYLSPKGFAEKSRLVAAYINVSLEFFRQAREEYRALLADARNRGYKRLALAGGGELAEIAVIAAYEFNVEFVAVLDSSSNQAQLLGLPVVRGLEELGDFDAILLTDSRSSHEVFSSLTAELTADRILVPPMLRITLNGGRADEQTSQAIGQ